MIKIMNNFLSKFYSMYDDFQTQAKYDICEDNAANC